MFVTMYEVFKVGTIGAGVVLSTANWQLAQHLLKLDNTRQLRVLFIPKP